MKKTQLDFLIIGAQKAGTTSLASYLGECREIYIPPEKEIPYFLEPQMQGYGWDAFLDIYFRKVRPECLWGTSTPQYMMFPESFARIAEAMPSIKVIAIVRDPVRRLLSHFDMLTRFGMEARDLNSVIADQLENIERCRQAVFPEETAKYIAGGEYGRILRKLFECVPSSQVLVLQFDDLTKNTQQMLGPVCSFLGVEEFTPRNLGKVSMQGGSRKLIPFDHDRVLRAAAACVKASGISKWVSPKFKARVGLLSSKLDEWNVDPSSKSSIKLIEPALLEKLFALYREDAEILATLGVSASWKAAWR